MQWEIIDSGTLPAEENMRVDGELLANLAITPKHILRFYDWKNPSLSYGHFIKPEEHLNLEAAETLGIEIARRPTGGGVISHFTDFTFSILVPKNSPYYTTDTLTNYCFVNKKIQNALKGLCQDDLQLLATGENSHETLDRFCMAKPTVLDVMCGPLKVSGGAQRRTKHGFLHQGTISLAPPNWDWLYRVIRHQEVVDQMKMRSHYLPNIPKTAIKDAIAIQLMNLE